MLGWDDAPRSQKQNLSHGKANTNMNVLYAVDCNRAVCCLISEHLGMGMKTLACDAEDVHTVVYESVASCDMYLQISSQTAATIFDNDVSPRSPTVTMLTCCP